MVLEGNNNTHSHTTRMLIYYTLDFDINIFICGSFVKQLAWLIAIIQSLLIVASRKHYTVDVVVAW